jgi:hypothetical protein
MANDFEFDLSGSVEEYVDLMEWQYAQVELADGTTLYITGKGQIIVEDEGKEVILGRIVKDKGYPYSFVRPGVAPIARDRESEKFLGRGRAE